MYTKETYSEICEFLELIGDKYINKIPKKLLQLFEENKSENYVPHIKPNIPIKEQSLSEDTLAIIALLNLKYWCEDENEIERLKYIYKKNEDTYQKNIKGKFNSSDIFKNKRKEDKVTDITEIVEYKQLPFYKKLVNWIKEKIIRKHN